MVKSFFNITDSFSTGSGYVYPDYYGYAEIVDDTLIIKVTTDDDSVVNDIKQRTKNDNYKIELCKYSYNQLEKASNLIEEIKDEYKIDHIVIDGSKNKILVCVSDESMFDSEDFFKIINRDMVEINFSHEHVVKPS